MQDRPRHWAEFTVPAGVIDSNGVIRDPMVVGDGLRRMVGIAGPRPKAVWVVLSSVAAVQHSVRVPSLWPWQQRLAAESIARRLLVLNHGTTHLDVRWHRRTLHVTAMLQDAVAGAVASVRRAGLQVQGLETAADVLARCTRIHVSVRITPRHLLVVMPCHGLPAYSGCTERTSREALAPQILSLLAAAHEEAGSTVMPGQGPLALVGLDSGTDGEDALEGLRDAGWQPYPFTRSGLPSPWLPAGPPWLPPFGRVVGRRWKPLAAADAGTQAAVGGGQPGPLRASRGRRGPGS